MVIALGLAAGLVIGAPLRALAVLGIAVWQPVWALGALLVWVALNLRRPGLDVDETEAAYLQAVAGDLRAGSSLRCALSTASQQATGLRLDRAARLAVAGQPLGAVADELERALPRLGRLAASAVRTAGVTGGKAADVFDGLALLANEELSLIRERRAATAQTRFSAWIVGGIPVAYLLFAGVTGRLAVLRTTGPIGVVLLSLGLAFLGGGIFVIWATLRGAER